MGRGRSGALQQCWGDPAGAWVGCDGRGRLDSYALEEKLWSLQICQWNKGMPGNLCLGT